MRRRLHRLGCIRRALFRLAVKLLRRSRSLVDDAFCLAFRVPGDVPETFLRFAAEVLCRTKYSIFIHGDASRTVCWLQRGWRGLFCSPMTHQAAYENSNADGHCKRDERPMLDLLGQPAPCVVAELCRLAAEIGGLLAY